MPPLKNPLLVAVWPGMGQIALIAGEYLARQLRMRRVGEFPSERFFEVEQVAVHEGIATVAPRPRCQLFVRKDPQRRQDIVLLIAEAQPAAGGYTLCEQVAERAKSWGVQRIITFAAMASPLHPSQPARVFAAATGRALLDELKRLDAEPLDEGQISGMNGLMLAAAQQQGIEAACLLGELPYFATQVPNPKAAAAALRTFAAMADLDLDFGPLDERAAEIDGRLARLLQELQRQAEATEGEEEESFSPAATEAEAEPADRPKLEPQAERRIERLFEQARQDRSKAFELKRELDRHGVFEEYEDRFLDLFKQGG